MTLRICVAGFFISTLLVFANLYERSSYIESKTCKNVRGVVERLYHRHVESLNTAQTFETYYGDLLERGALELLNRLDPFKILFTKEEVQNLTAKNALPLPGLLSFAPTCDDYFTISFFSQKKLKKAALELPKVFEAIDFKRRESYAKKFEAYMENEKRWAVDNQERMLAMKWAYASALVEAAEHETHEGAVRRLARRIFERKITDLQISTQTNFSSVVLKSIVASMDAHSQFFSMDEYNEAIRSLMSTFVGIGVIVAEVELGYKVLELIPGGPAEREGKLQAGDTITRVEQVPIAGERRENLAKLLSGPTGSSVKLSVLNSERVRTVEVTRGPVRTANSTVDYDLKVVDNKKLGRIKLDHFYTDDSGINSAYLDIAAAVSTLTGQGAEGLIIDLRDNGGGVLSEVVNIAGLFIDAGPIVFEYGTLNKGLNAYDDTDGQSLYKGPLVILVNENSASAAEILAGSLKTYRRAIVVGTEQTYGKGTIQEIGPLVNIWDSSPIDGAVKLTVGYYYLPDGRSVQFDGVKPDISLGKVHEHSELERKLPMALERPVDIGLEFKPYSPWMNEEQFGKMVTFVEADNKAKEILDIKLSENVEDPGLARAMSALSGMVSYFKLYLPGLVAAKVGN